MTVKHIPLSSFSSSSFWSTSRYLFPSTEVSTTHDFKSE
jgi:hypothetical protein